jgi:hypothetical protein
MHLDVFVGSEISFELTANRYELLLHILHHIRLHVRHWTRCIGKET